MERKAYPPEVRDDEWALVAPYLPLLTAVAPPRAQSLREVCNGRRGIGRAGAVWRLMPHALPPWPTVSHQRPRWRNAGGPPSCLTSARCCGWPRDARPNLPPPFSIAAPIDAREWHAGGRFRRLSRDYEQLAETLAGLHCVVFVILMLKHFVELLV
jgi:transposase